VERLMADAIQQTSIADRGRSLTGERAQAMGELGIAPQPFDIIRDRGHNAAHRHAVRRDRYRDCTERAALGQEVGR
jgi:hypothetical protein